ncbi:hypothetical protein AOZ06_03480 [Kibdelosporangium phytohabitans]|uniref:Lipoprotein n=2 Tax=Kibdelosporangium phytohabitans TaxID=860235 RepID=A0A0N9HP43_9PSEU|nr:hypothetical protein AOZ06_03480 [Kibdelosporangium phytohabitans]
MRRFAYAALIATGALAIAAPIAGATPTGAPSGQTQTDEGKLDPSKAKISVSPGKGEPGAKISVSLYCGAEVNASGIDAPALLLGKAEVVEGTVYMVEAKVRPDARPGKYTVSFKCPGKAVSAAFEVVAPKGKAPQQPKQQVKVKPKGAAQTGGGATAS